MKINKNNAKDTGYKRATLEQVIAACKSPDSRYWGVYEVAGKNAVVVMATVKRAIGANYSGTVNSIVLDDKDKGLIARQKGNKIQFLFRELGSGDSWAKWDRLMQE